MNGRMVNFEDFAKVDLRVGKIIEAIRVEGSPKLLKLKVSFGDAMAGTGLGQKQILAGIGKVYEPESLIGKNAAFVFNLEPRVLMGEESQGMILAVSDENNLSILSPDKDIASGSRIS